MRRQALAQRDHPVFALEKGDVLEIWPKGACCPGGCAWPRADVGERLRLPLRQPLLHLTKGGVDRPKCRWQPERGIGQDIFTRPHKSSAAGWSVGAITLREIRR